MSACNAHWSAHRQGTLSNLIVGGVGVAIGLISFALSLWLAIFVISAGASLLIMTWARFLLWRRFFREAKKYNDDVSVVFRDDAVHVESAEGKSDLNWDFFSWYLDTADYVLLYTTKRQFSVVPKKSFPDSESLRRFLEQVEKKLKRIR
jgi:hypothetical protein